MASSNLLNLSSHIVVMVLVVMGVTVIGAIISVHLLFVALPNFGLSYYTCHLNAPNDL
jgi:hypothetical protein